MVAFVVALQVVQFPMRLAHVPNVPGVVVISAIALAFYADGCGSSNGGGPTSWPPAPRYRKHAGSRNRRAVVRRDDGSPRRRGRICDRGFGGWSGVAAGFIVMLGAAVVEEVLFRGFLFRTIRDIGGTWIAVAVSAVVFGALHAFNPGASAVSTIAIALEAGVLLALSYAATNRLWLPIGLHLGWNFAEGSIFGTAVSATRSRALSCAANCTVHSCSPAAASDPKPRSSRCSSVWRRASHSPSW